MNEFERVCSTIAAVLIVFLWVAAIVVGDVAALLWVGQDAHGTTAGHLGVVAGLCVVDCVWLGVTALLMEWDRP